MQPGVERGSGRPLHTIVYLVHYRAPERNVLAPSQNRVSQYFMDRRVYYMSADLKFMPPTDP